VDVLLIFILSPICYYSCSISVVTVTKLPKSV
jgi:hypothetical protein